MARRDPERFKGLIVQHMGSTTELGAETWNHAIDAGTLDPNNFSVNLDTWASFSRASDGFLALGVAEMSESEKNRYLYLGEHMSYEDEVSRRLLHEVTHGGVALAHESPSMNTLLRAALSLRTAGTKGLTSLGSHSFYKTPNDRAIEDVVELLTMREISAEHLDGYLEILSSNRYVHLRETMGLATIGDHEVFKELIEGAVGESLTATSLN